MKNEKCKIETRKEYEKSIKESQLDPRKFVSYEEYLRMCRILGDEIPDYASL